MYLVQLELHNVRSVQNFSCTFNKDVNLIYGNNGEGKTTILEGIHLLSLGKSFRTGYSKNIIMQGKETLLSKGIIKTEIGETLISCGIAGKRKKIKIDNEQIRSTSELIGTFPVVVMAPEDADIISGTNQTRINFINRILSIINKEYLQTLREYNLLLKHRNKLLNEQQMDVLSVINQQVGKKGISLWRYRIKFMNDFCSDFRQHWKSVLPELIPNIEYRHKSADSVEDYLTQFKKISQKEKILGRTLFGPHRDKFVFTLNNNNIRDFGSQGEKKFFLAVLKQTEAGIIHNNTGKAPVLLMDDLFAKLDRQRIKKIMALFIDKYQLFITTTDRHTEDMFAGNSTQVKFITLGEA